MVPALVLRAGMDPARAETVTRFVEPQQYTDAQNRFGSGLSLRVTIGEIRRIIEGEGRRVLRSGESLMIDVVDIDLAGFEQPGASFLFGVRVVRDIGPPRLRLRYVLSANRRRILAREETLTGQKFLIGAAVRSGGTFSDERELIRSWMQERFAERREAQS